MISKGDIEHLKNLARVEFGERETEALTKDLGAILEYVDQLKEVDVSSVAEMTYAHTLTNIVRTDELKAKNPDFPESRNAIVEAFPESKNDYLKVKAILS